MPKVQVFCLFILILLLNHPLARAKCEKSGDYVVVNIQFDDPVRGLHVREAATQNSMSLGVIPWDGIGIDVQSCEVSGWCRVRYGCLEGWSHMARYLAPQARRLVRVSGVTSSDPEGLNGRTGPDREFSFKTRFQFNARGLIKHSCLKSRQGSEWCLVSQEGRSGWVSSRYLTADGPSSGGYAPNPPSGIGSRGCQLYPDLC